VTISFSYNILHHGVSKQASQEPTHLNLMPAKVKNAWSHTSTFSIRLHGLVLGLKKAQGQLSLHLIEPLHRKTRTREPAPKVVLFSGNTFLVCSIHPFQTSTYLSHQDAVKTSRVSQIVSAVILKYAGVFIHFNYATVFCRCALKLHCVSRYNSSKLPEELRKLTNFRQDKSPPSAGLLYCASVQHCFLSNRLRKSDIRSLVTF
jgi:hypothetical protein